MSFEGKSQQEPRNWQMDRILIILKKGKPPKGFICPCTGVKYHNIQTCLLVYAADSGEHLQDHWSSGFLFLLQNIDFKLYVLSKNKKNIKKILLKFFIFNNFKNICILHGHVFIMQLRGCQLSKTNTCIIFTCIKKMTIFLRRLGILDTFLYESFNHRIHILLCPKPQP